MRLLSKKPTAPAAEADAAGLGLREVAAQTGPWPGASSIATKCYLGAIIAGFLCGPIALASAIAANRPTEPVSAATAVAGGERAAAAAAAAAENLVSLYLSSSSADQDKVRALVAHAPTSIHLPEIRPVPPSWVGALHTDQTPASGEATRWQVVVATTTATGSTGWQVIIDVTASGAKALALPVPVALPTGPDLPRAAQNLPNTHPAATTAGGFAAASLTGQTDLARWASPGYTPTPVIPAACTTTELQGATSLTGPLAAEPTPDDTAQVLVSLTCSNPSQTPAATTSPDPTDTKTSAPIADSTRSVQLLVHLTGRDGRWEVAPLTTTHP